MFQAAIDLGYSARLISGVERQSLEAELTTGHRLILVVDPAVLYPGRSATHTV
jgi:hypothetical protein